MINIKNLNSITLDDTTADIVTIAKLAFNRGVAADLITALGAYEQSLLAQAQMSEIAIDNSQIAELQQEITDRNKTIAQLQLEVAPDIAAITPALMTAGLLAWGNRATAADSENVLELVMELRDTAMAPRSINQCNRIKYLFGEICSLSGVSPTSTEAKEMQAILDKGTSSTGPVDAKYLSFVPWI